MAIADQALTSGVSLIISLLLLKWSSIEQLGVFSAINALYLLFFSIFSSLIIDPMIVFFNGKYAESRKSYTSILYLALYSTSIIIIVSCFAAYTFFSLTNEASYAKASLIFIFFAISQLFFALERRIMYAKSRSSLSVLGALVAALLTLLLSYLVKETFVTSALSMMYTVTISYLMGALIMRRARIMAESGENDRNSDLKTISVAKDHYYYGSWALMSSIVAWLPVNLYYLIGQAGEAESSGSLRILLMIILPAQLTVANLSYYLTPKMTRSSNKISLIKNYIIISIACCITYYLLVIIFGKNIISFIEPKNEELVSYVKWFGLLPILTGVQTIVNSALRAAERTKEIFISQIIASLISCAIGVLVFQIDPLTGAFWGLTAYYGILIIGMFVSLKKGGG
ncbi:hypothetical protein [Deinococcus sp. RM]|uniref:hypothetical protein n=1 Tax=Deinococcus sp. RM TaxID=2316359 RepID=UPI0011C22D96|nr:hypothetical protein [Deinococcus sp. RM]